MNKSIGTSHPDLYSFIIDSKTKIDNIDQNSLEHKIAIRYNNKEVQEINKELVQELASTAPHLLKVDWTAVNKEISPRRLKKLDLDDLDKYTKY